MSAHPKTNAIVEEDAECGVSIDLCDTNTHSESYRNTLLKRLREDNANGELAEQLEKASKSGVSKRSVLEVFDDTIAEMKANGEL